MKTLARKSPKISGMTKRLRIIKCLPVLACLGSGMASSAWGQESWSDSVPRSMKLAIAGCPIKVRGKSGEWGQFKDSLPKGRNVIGAINPRRPDLVFFQLSRDSEFMFVAPRTCFEGEGDWSVAVEEEKHGGQRPRKSTHAFILASVDVIADRVSLSPIDGATGDSFPLRTRLIGGCAGGGFEIQNQSWYWGSSACVGGGRAQFKFVPTGEDSGEDSAANDYSDAVTGFYGNLRGTGYYDFQTLPYAMGLELYVGFSKVNFGSPSLVNYEITPQMSVTYGVSAAWRFYWDNAAITPKITFNKFLPRNIGVELQFAYLFGGR